MDSKIRIEIGREGAAKDNLMDYKKSNSQTVDQIFDDPVQVSRSIYALSPEGLRANSIVL